MRFAKSMFDAEPSLFITEDCPITWKAMQQIQVDKRNIETYDTKGFDHPVDALRYGVVEIPIEQGYDTSPPEVFGDRISGTEVF